MNSKSKFQFSDLSSRDPLKLKVKSTRAHVSQGLITALLQGRWGLSSDPLGRRSEHNMPTYRLWTIVVQNSLTSPRGALGATASLCDSKGQRGRGGREEEGEKEREGARVRTPGEGLHSRAEERAFWPRPCRGPRQVVSAVRRGAVTNETWLVRQREGERSCATTEVLPEQRLCLGWACGPGGREERGSLGRVLGQKTGSGETVLKGSGKRGSRAVLDE
eukprot:871118-Rhodomonas_salina.1